MEKEAPQPGKDPAPPQHREQGFAKNKNLRKGRDWGVGEGRGGVGGKGVEVGGGGMTKKRKLEVM